MKLRKEVIKDHIEVTWKEDIGGWIISCSFKNIDKAMKLVAWRSNK